MTEVPEHLLQRSRARRAALGLGGDAGEAPASTPAVAAAATPAPATEAAPAAAAAAAPPAPKAPERLAPYVEAAVARKKIPYWVMPVLAFLPIWALMYAFTLDKPTPKAAGPITEGATVYGANCAGCHGPTGGGIGSAPKLSGGAVDEVFTTAADQLYWVMEGTEGFQALGLATYGAAEKPVGGSGGKMPGWKDSLTAEELIAVIRHERETFAGQTLDAAALKQEYDEILAMVEENYPDRKAEFEEAINTWASLPPTA